MMTPAPDPPPPDPKPGGDPPSTYALLGVPRPAASASRLDQALKGNLPCIGCSYELQGLSVRGQCPECGLAIRATILYRVDPHAEAFQPMPFPRLTAWLIALWSFSGFAAVLSLWIPRVADLLAKLTGARIPTDGVGLFSCAALTVSGLAATALVRPLRDTERRHIISAFIACLAYIPLVAGVWVMQLRLDPFRIPPYLTGAPQTDRLGLRLAIAALSLVILLGLRPNARRLAARSLVLRTGRVDRQTMAATAAAIGLAALGDAVRFLSLSCPKATAGMIDQAGSLLVLVGSLLITLAILGVAIDSWRIRRAILTPSPSLSDVLGDH